MAVVGFLHTAEVHISTFAQLVEKQSAAGQDVKAVHVVAPGLLDRARVDSPAAVATDVASALGRLVSAGADVIVCTCSTLGDVAETVALERPDGTPITVIRGDRPMARAAVGAGPRIGVVAALASTLEPTTALISGEAARVSADIEITVHLAEAAWTAFEAGETVSYREQIAAAVRELAPRVDVVLLAQASMAGALPLLDDVIAAGTTVLASPELAVAAALDAGTASYDGVGLQQ